METGQNSNGKKDKIPVFSYTDYRQLLKDYMKVRQARESHFSLRMFSRLSGFQCHNYMSLILQGKRNLASDHVRAITGVLKLTRQETEYFEILVAFNQSRTKDLQNRYITKLLSYWKRNPVTTLNPAQYEIVSRWYCLVIREMVLLDDFKNDPEWIARRLGKPVTASDVEEALRLLKECALLKEVDGKLTQVDSNVLAEGEVPSLAIRNYHRNFIPKGIEALDTVPIEEREINGTTIAVSPETFKKIKKRLKEFQVELLQMIPHDDKQRRIYQLNVQLFPVLKRED